MYVIPSLMFLSNFSPRWDGLVVSVSASHAVGHGFAPVQGHTKDQHINGTNCLLLGMHALG